MKRSSITPSLPHLAREKDTSTSWFGEEGEEGGGSNEGTKKDRKENFLRLLGIHYPPPICLRADRQGIELI